MENDQTIHNSILCVFTLFMAYDTLYYKWKEIKFNNDKKEVNVLADNEKKELKNQILIDLKRDLKDDLKIYLNNYGLLDIELNQFKKNVLDKQDKLIGQSKLTNQKLDKISNNINEEVKMLEKIINEINDRLNSQQNEKILNRAVKQEKNKAIVNKNEEMNNEFIVTMIKINKLSELSLELQKTMKLISFNAKIEANKWNNSVFGVIASQLKRNTEDLQEVITNIKKLSELYLEDNNKSNKENSNL